MLQEADIGVGISGVEGMQVRQKNYKTTISSIVVEIFP